MKFKCDKGDVFAYPAKRIVNSYDHRVENDLYEKATDVNTGFILSSLEVQVCPICDSKVFEEVVEIKPLETLAVSEWIEAPHSEANAKLKEGYQVYKEYSKTVIMIKPKVEGAKA
jgi:hypothetical protein